jgi:hypothetical protein
MSHNELSETHPNLSVIELAHSGSKKAWATLKVNSRAHSLQQLPSLVEGDDIVGSFRLDLENDDPIHSIKISVS